MSARNIGFILRQRFKPQDFAREHEGVARRQPFDEIFLQFAQDAAPARDRAGRPNATAARAHEPHLDHGFLHDGADVEPILLGDARMADAVASILAGSDLGKALVDLERVAAGCNEIHHGVKIRPRQAGERRRRSYFLEQFMRQERLAARTAQHVLRQHVERAGAQRRSILCAFGDRSDGGMALQHLEPICRNEHRM